MCIAVDQHTALHRDNRNRLHCTDGAAWAWADGTQIYALDGIRVPEWVVRRPDPKRIISDELPNTEQRRVAMAHYGWDRAVDDLNLKIIEASDNPVWGTLYAARDARGAGSGDVAGVPERFTGSRWHGADVRAVGVERGPDRGRCPGVFGPVVRV